MSQTLYATFSNSTNCEQAAGALLDYGVRKEDISLVAHENFRNADATEYTTANTGAPVAALRTDPATGTNYGYAVAGVGNANTTLVADKTAEYDTEHDNSDVEEAAKHGISVTTGADAAAGAAKGAGWGLGLGILAGIACLAVPGVGWVVGGGALATAIGGAIATTAAGAVSGGVVGYFKDQGIPNEVAVNYDKAVQEGGAVLAVLIPSDKIDLATAEQILHKYGANNIAAY